MAPRLLFRSWMGNLAEEGSSDLEMDNSICQGFAVGRILEMRPGWRADSGGAPRRHTRTFARGKGSTWQGSTDLLNCTICIHGYNYSMEKRLT